MIYLNEVCEKLQEILNSENNPAGFLYAVESVGFHADTVYDKAEGKNLIRVFISSMGGNFNPIYGLGEANYTIPITFYFPVRFKDSFFVLDGYLHSLFVGATLNYGENSGDAISNLSVATYGEIQDLDFKEFKKWADSLYRKPIEVMEPYMSMTLNLYLTCIGKARVGKYLMGNEVTATATLQMLAADWLSKPSFSHLYTTLGTPGVRCEFADIYIQYLNPDVLWHGYAFVALGGIFYADLDKTWTPEGTYPYVYTYINGRLEEIGTLNQNVPSWTLKMEEQMTFAQGSLQTMIQASEQKQLFDATETDGVPYSEATSQSFAAYVCSNYFWRVITFWQANGKLSTLDFKLKWNIASMPIDIERKVYLASFNLPITKGNPLVASMTFSKRSE